MKTFNADDPFGLGNHASAVPQTTTTTAKKKKGFWEDQISTGGSLGGALAGGAAGTAILPGVGTLIGALLGGAAGGFGGQVAENKVTGEQDIFKDAGTEALWGGATALPFGAGLKLAGAGLKAGAKTLTGGALNLGKKSAMDLVQEAGIQTMSKKALGKATLEGSLSEGAQAAATRIADKKTLGQKFGSKLSGTADNLAVKQFRLTPTQLGNFKTKFSEDAGQTIRKYGFESAEDIAAKGIDPLNTQFGELVNGIGQVSKQTLQNKFAEIGSKLAKSASTTNQSIGKAFDAESAQILAKYGDVIDAKELNAIRREFDGLVNYTNKAADPAKYGVNKRVADALRKTLQESDSTGQLKNVGQEISKLRQLSDVVSKQAQLGRGSLPLNIPSLLGSVGGAGVGGVPGMAVGLAATQAINSNAGRKVAMGTVDKIAGKLAQSAPRDIGQTLQQAATRIGGVGIAKSALGGQSSDGSNMDTTAPMSNATTMPTIVQNINSQYTQNQMPSSPLGVSSAKIGQALMKAYAAGDKAAIEQLGGMYELASTFEANSAKSQEAPKLSQGQQERQDLITSLDNTESIMAGGSVDYGPIGSRINDVKALFNNADPETLAYKNTIQGMRAAITKARAGASLTEGELKMLKQYTPEYTDTEQVVRSKLTALRQLYGYSAPNISGGIDQATLEAALSQR